MSVSSEAILERFAQIVANSLRIDASRVVNDACLNDLGAESLDLLEITMEAEDAFSILIPQKTILQTAQEVYGAGVLETDGHLTEFAQAMLRSRLPDQLWSSLPERPTVADVNRLFLRVQTWVWMIAGLVEHTPNACSQCGAPFGKKAIAGRLKCPACAAEHELVPGEELNRRWVQRYQQECGPSAPTVPAA